MISEEAVRLIASDRVNAHAVLFAHRHGEHAAPFHAEVITALHSGHPRVVIEAFRGAAKSTMAEEATILRSALEEFRNGLLIGASYDRACERLESLKHEYENNDDLSQIFGSLRGLTTWTGDKIILANGVVLQAKGAGQSLRGVKHHDIRPDFVVIDDLEDEESVRTPPARQEMLRWLYKTLIPALTKNAIIWFLGNRLDPDAVIVKISKRKEWHHRRYPIMTQDVETGEDVPTWPALFPLEWIYAKRAEMQELGLFEDFNQEFMCDADTPEERIFRPEHFTSIVRPRVRTWEATWVMVDPARSVNKRSATTAIAVWSWINNRLVVWECLIAQLLPDKIIEKMVEVDREYRPVVMGVEEDALNQFILQPLRHAQVKYGQPIPIRPMAAKKYTEGRGKHDFIKAQQPFFAAGEVEFAKPLPELVAQFLSYPKGTIDGPNALAYALKMRPGLAVYDEFTRENVQSEVALLPNRTVYLAMNATRGYVTAVLLQYDGIALHILADYVDEGDPGQVAGPIVRRANMDAGGKPIRFVAPPLHFEQWSNVGLRAALSRVPADLTRGGDPLRGREEIRRLLTARHRDLPAVLVGHAARWTLNAFSGGYASVNGKVEEGVYERLMVGLESFAAMAVSARADDPMDERDGLNYREGASGRRYLSAMPDRR